MLRMGPSRRSAARLLMAALCLPLATPTVVATVAAAGTVPFRRGIGITHTLAWADVEGGAESRFRFPPFSGPDRAMTAAEMRNLREAGLDFVRLGVDPGPFLQFTGRQRDWMDRTLSDSVKRFLDADLGVIVDIHPSDLAPDYVADRLTEGVRAPRFRAYLELVAQMAEQLAALRSHRVALELFNEPSQAPEVWQPMLEAAYAAARKRAPRLPLVLGGGGQNGLEGLLKMDLRPFLQDPAVIYTFHDYEPYQYTHQGAAEHAAADLVDVPYPASARPLSDTLAASRRAIAASDRTPAQRAEAEAEATRHIDHYARFGFDRAALSRSFDDIADWARRHGIAPGRILLGEFGARLTPFSGGAVQRAERRRYLRDMREVAEAHGFAWSVFAYRGLGGFALARNETGPDLDPLVTDALGLRMPGEQRKTR